MDKPNLRKSSWLRQIRNNIDAVMNFLLHRTNATNDIRFGSLEKVFFNSQICISKVELFKLDPRLRLESVTLKIPSTTFVDSAVYELGHDCNLFADFYGSAFYCLYLYIHGSWKISI